jgi:hypothetical protein
MNKTDLLAAFFSGLIALPATAQSNFQCVSRSELRSTFMQPQAIRGAVGVSASYCMGFADLREEMQGRPALSAPSLQAAMQLTRNYDQSCGFDFGQAPETAFVAAKLQLRTFGPDNLNWVRAVTQDCTRILQALQSQ